MRWNRSQDGDGNFHDVNMTPLIDVSLVLVVILLLATPLAFESSFALRGIGRTDRTAAEQKEIARVELEIVSDTDVKVNRKVVAVANLESTLRTLLDGNATREVSVDCNDEVSHGAFVTVLDITKASGASDIAVVGR